MFSDAKTLVLLATLLLLMVGCRPRSSEPVEQPLTESITTPEWYRPGEVDSVKVATWNVQHFVDPYDNPYIENEREDLPPSDMGNRRKLFAEAIKNLDADVVVLQEFESDSYLRQLSENYFPEMGYRVFAALESADWYMNVVMMSRIPLGTFYSYAHINTPIVDQVDSLGNTQSQTFINNRMWSADIIVNSGYRFTLTGLHLKAGRGDRNEGWRLGQINLLRSQFKRLMALDNDRNMLIAGDLNTTPDSREFNVLLGNNDRPEFIDPLAGSGTFTHPSDSLFWRIDHLLPNRAMQPELVPGSVTAARPLPMDQMIMISDHLPVTAVFTPREQQ